MRVIIYVVFAVFALWIESAVLTAWPTGMLRLELLWIGVFYVGLTQSFSDGLGCALWCGLLEDLAGAPWIGFFTSLYVCVFLLLRLFIGRLFLESLWSRLMWLGLFSFVLLNLEWLLLRVLHPEADLGFYILTYGVLQSVMNMGMAALIFPLLMRIDKNHFTA